MFAHLRFLAIGLWLICEPLLANIPLPSKNLVELVKNSHIPDSAWVGEYEDRGFDFFVYISLVQHDFSEYERSRNTVFSRAPTIVSGIASGGFVKKRGIDSQCQIAEEDHTPVSGYKSASGKIQLSGIWKFDGSATDRSFDYFLDEKEKGKTWKVRINYAWHRFKATETGSYDVVLYRAKDLREMIVSD